MKNRSARAAWLSALAVCSALWFAPRESVAEGDDTPLITLVALASQRLALALPVAHWKWANNRPIEDPQREAVLLREVDARARAAGVDPAFAQRFFRDQIDASKQMQTALFEKWRTTRPPQGPAPELGTTTRPALDRLTQSMIASLVGVQALRDAPDCPSRLARSVQNWKQLTHYDATEASALATALAHVCAAGSMSQMG